MPNIIETIRNLPIRKKVILLSVLVASMAAIVLMFAWIQRIDYQVLFSNISDTDSGSIVQKLKEMKVPYKVDAGKILVPSDKVYDVRFQLAAQGIPQNGGVGFELFDKMNFGTSDFVQKLNYRRALQGELARTIMSMQEVEQCRVHLAIPEKSLFMQEELRSSASAVIKLKPGRSLSQTQVQGIVHLISSSVEGLNPKDVTVLDSRGEMLTRHMDDVGGLTNSQLEYQRNYEKEIESRIIGILEPIVGKDKVKAKVAAHVDFTRSEKTEERFDPDSQVIRSEQRNTEKSSAGGSGGVPGVASNLPGKGSAAGSFSGGQFQKQNETVNYEINKVVSRVIVPPGDIKRLSVAVVVDGTYASEQGSKQKKYIARSDDDIKRYEELVKNAVGFNQDRGDEVRVINMSFESTQEEGFQEPKKDYLPIILTVSKYIAPLVAMILFFLFIVRPLIRTISAYPDRQQEPLALPQTVAQIEKTMEAELTSMRTDIVEWVRNNPKEAANLVKGWVEEK